MNLQVRSPRKSTRTQTRPSFVPAINPKLVTLYKDGGEPIENPKHGDTGHWKGQPVVYNSRWGNAEWLTVKDYQKKKVLGTGEPDYRLRPFADEAPKPKTSSRVPDSWYGRLIA